MTTWPLQKDCNTFYGNPATSKGTANTGFEKQLVSVKCPWVLRYDGKAVRGLRVHNKCAMSLQRVLEAIWKRAGKDQAVIDAAGLSVYGGGYNFRQKRGGSTLSMHSYGCAIDFDPANNGFGDKTPKLLTTALGRAAIEEFEREGWEWGGHWSKPDGMHFQAARTRATPSKLKVPAAAEKAIVSLGGVPAPASNPRWMRGVVYEPLERLQRAFKARGYYMTGNVDGKIGDKTLNAALAFKRDNGIKPLNDEIDEGLILLVELSPPKTQPVERALATPESLAPKSPVTANAVDASFWSKVSGGVGAITAGGAAIVNAAPDAVAKIDPVRALVPAGVSPWVWVAIVAVVAAGIAFAAIKATRKNNEIVDLKVDEYRHGGAA